MTTLDNKQAASRVSSALAAVNGQGLSLRVRSLAQRPERLTMRELIRRYMDAYTGRDTTRPYRLAVWDALIGDYEVSDIDADLVHAGRAELATQPPLVFKGLDHMGRQIFKTKGRQRTKSTATINRHIVALSAVFTWAIEQRLTPRGFVHPCRGIKRLTESDGRVRYLDADERARLFEACRQSRYPRLYALVLMALKTGARKGELLGLTWRDVDLDAGLAYLGRTKNGDRRTLVLLPDVVEVLRPFKSNDPARYVFGSVSSRYQEPARVQSAWREALSRAQVKDFRFHDLRHCCASYLAQAGADLHIVAEVLGHRTLAMARRYTHLTTANKAAAMAAALGSI